MARAFNLGEGLGRKTDVLPARRNTPFVRVGTGLIFADRGEGGTRGIGAGRRRLSSRHRVPESAWRGKRVGLPLVLDAAMGYGGKATCSWRRHALILAVVASFLLVSMPVLALTDIVTLLLATMGPVTAHIWLDLAALVAAGGLLLWYVGRRMDWLRTG